MELILQKAVSSLSDNTNLIFTIMAYVISDDCVACGTCIDECPQGAISEGEKYSINPEMCIAVTPPLFLLLSVVILRG